MNYETSAPDCPFFVTEYGDAYCRRCGKEYHNRLPVFPWECDGNCKGDGLVPGAGQTDPEYSDMDDSYYQKMVEEFDA